VAGDGPALRLRLVRDPRELSRLAGEVQAFLGRHPPLAGLGHPLQLALEELVSNVIRHAADEGIPLDIDVALEPARDGVHVRIEDDGPAFDPLAVAAPDVEAPLERRTLGGLGIHLVRHVAADLSYARRAGRNCISLRIPLPGV
jgi:serine/threonine-protein kinase RsbW